MGLIAVPIACFIVGLVLGTIWGRGIRGAPVNLVFTRSQRGRIRYKYEHAISGRTVAVSPSSSATLSGANEIAPEQLHVVKTIDQTGK